MSRGVLYIATGEEFVEEARASARSVARAMDCEIAIATDDATREIAEFDHVIEHEAETRTYDGRSWLLDSTIPPDLSPFEKTLYLDSDTYVAEGVDELWGLLDDYDLAVARTPSYPNVGDHSDLWGQYNCGVIAYRDTGATRSSLERWRAGYGADLAAGDPRDQPSFARELATDTELRWSTLPRAYNVRVPGKGELTDRAKIVHGRHPSASLPEIAAELNGEDGHKLYAARSYWTAPTHSITAHNRYRYNVERGLSEHGLAWTAKRAIVHVLDRALGSELYERHFADDGVGWASEEGGEP